MPKTTFVNNSYSHYETIIGIEVHVQLTTKSKIFCLCNNEISKKPNSNICEICAGYPGSLPTLNKKVVDYAILAGLATNCSIAKRSSFARKHYFYPDLPKGYQITQHTDPICIEGYIPIRLENGNIKKIRLIRIHMEEDAGKSIHIPESNESFVDLNRTGTPLLEIVSYPDISNSYEAKAYLKTLRSIVQYLNIGTGNMEEGAFRADTNVSIRKKGTTKLGIRCELKNINSFKFIGDAIEYEINRQVTLLEHGEDIVQETRLWNAKNKKTFSMRTKEEAADYRYFQEPDLPLLEITNEWIDRIKQHLPELPHEKFERLCTQQGLSPYEAEILVDDIILANYFEEAHQYSKSKQIINWILRDVLGYLKEHGIPLSEFKVTPKKLSEIIELIETGIINVHAAKELFTIVAQTGQAPADIVKEKGFEQIVSIEKLEPIVKEVIASYPNEKKAYLAGKEKLFSFFVGQIMKKTKGKASPQVIQELLKKELKK
ncbi:Asp-tRNA(Asn)/Glu-tRNA(Gln) amidotransferase subunit GatB [Candidatus Dependentiae bacterium]|nr:MAG: Asp-tRNA(Asn)/Glu-tRNA(Gln) amidotransferase subunit GatB [Candidatus Dependentiae bacterium]